MCCKSCDYLGEKGILGHDIECDIRDNNAICHPWYWSEIPTDEKEFLKFHAEVGGAYVQAMGTKLIKKSMPEYEVKSCVRCENGNLWRAYAEKRAAVRSRGGIKPLKDIGHRLGYAGTSSTTAEPETNGLLEYSALTTLDKSVNEVWLFHGTSQEAAKAIAQNDFRLPGFGGNFGKGLYFAERACKSHFYSKQNSDGFYVMMLCRVVLGSVLEMDSAERDQSAENRILGKPDLDSILGNANPKRDDGHNAREYLVYEPSQVYPEYIIYYKA